MSLSHSNTTLHNRLIKLGLSIDEEEEDDSEVLPELESDDVADSSTMEEVDWEPPSSMHAVAHTLHDHSTNW